MMKGKGFLQLLIVLLVVGAIAFVSVVGIGEEKSGSMSDVKLGLDLAGGVSITYQTVKEDPTSAELNDTVYKMQKRAEGFSTEAEVYPEGNNRITVAIPDVTDADSVLEKLGSAGNIYFIYGKGPDGVANISYNADGSAKLARSIDDIIADGDLVIDGSDILDAQPKMYQDQYSGTQYVVDLSFNSEGTSKFATATSYAYNASSGSLENVIAIVYDGEVVSAPGVSSVISEGQAQIRGQSDYNESNVLATTIRVGALPLELSVLRYYVEGAQLGANALDTSLIAGAIGIGLIILFMIIMYRIPGLAASIALLFYVGCMIVCLNLFDVTLTLPGIAGIILSVGMAVDANVIIFTRIQEELGSGKTVRSSIKLGFNKALSAIIDGNITTIIAAIVLYILGSGTVKGFAQTLAIGIILSMITALFVTKFILNAFVKLGAEKVGCFGEKKGYKHMRIVENFPKFAAISGVVIVAGIVAIIINIVKIDAPFNYGLDFSGGTATTFTMDGALPSDINTTLDAKIRSELGISAVISTVEDSSMVTVRTKELSTDDRAKLTNIITSDYSVKQENITTESVGATVSGEMKKDALIAVIVATICMLIYIWFRFKNLSFGLSSVIALIHDVLVVITVYAIAKDVISVGNTFIACLLTIVGYSINATIVIFDRIRENMSEKLDKESVTDVVNKSISQTFTRSIYTSLTTLIMVVLLAIFGVSSVREFAIPLIAGIVAGGFSSVCIAGGIWHLFGKKKAKAEN
ncbi:MAG: protein translocase subunit SecD [Lachnospiraceae bacterium]|nr:protein translocase subunit SecD [Lachnospiraceae bacterium]